MLRALTLRVFALALSVITASSVAVADPGYYVVTAYPNEGLRSIDFRYWTTQFPNQKTSTWPEVGFGYGVTSRWYTELYASGISYQGNATKLSTVNWQNEFLLTQGEWPVDVAMHLSIIREAHVGDGYSVEYGPVLQTDIGRTQLNANIFFQRSFASGESSDTQMKYQWQVRRRIRPVLDLGLQGFGEVGTWNRWLARDRQSHRAGPAFFGSAYFGQKEAVLYQAAYLFGSVYGRHGNMFTARVQYVY